MAVQYFPANNMQIKFESMQARQVVSSQLRRSFVRLRRSKRRLGASLIETMYCEVAYIDLTLERISSRWSILGPLVMWMVKIVVLRLKMFHVYVRLIWLPGRQWFEDLGVGCFLLCSFKLNLLEIWILHPFHTCRYRAFSIRLNILVWNSGYSMRRMEKYFPCVGLTNTRSSGSKFRAKIRDQTVDSFTFAFLLWGCSTTLKLK